VDGTVVQEGKGVGGALVSIFDFDNNKVKDITTGPGGNFSFPLKPDEEYTFIITKEGFTTAKILYSTIGIAPEDAKKYKGVSNPVVEIFEMPSDPKLAAQIQDLMNKPIQSYMYDSDAKKMAGDETANAGMKQDFDKLAKLAMGPRALEKEAAEKAAAEKAAKEKAEAERLAKEKADAAKAEADRLAKEKADKAEADRLAKEKAAADEAEKNRLAKEKADAAKAEADRLAKEKADTDAEKARLAKEKADAAKAEADRLAKEQADAAAEKARLAKEKADAEKAEADRLAKEQADAAAEKARLAKEKADAEKAEADRIAKEKADADAAEKARIAKEKADAAAAEQARLDKEKADKEAALAEKLAKEKAAAEAAAEKERLAKEAEAKLNQQKYDMYMKRGDSATTIKNYVYAKESYMIASAVKPSEPAPKDKIVAVDKIIEAEKKAQYTNEYAKKYPEGVTEEKAKEGNANITRRIVVQGNKGWMYVKKETSFGVFYFKDGVTITETEWTRDTEVKK
jgi:hypothetical protein